MKKFALVLSLVFLAGAAFANEAKKADAAKPAAKAAAHPAAKTHEVNAEVASIDATAKTLTIKGEAGAADKTVPVEGKAIAELKTVKAGDKVTLTCRDNEAGEHQAVVNIKPAKAPAVEKK